MFFSPKQKIAIFHQNRKSCFIFSIQRIKSRFPAKNYKITISHHYWKIKFFRQNKKSFSPLKPKNQNQKLYFPAKIKKNRVFRPKTKITITCRNQRLQFSLKLENRTFPQNHVFHQNQKIVFSRQTVYCVISPITLFFQQNSTIVFFFITAKSKN